MAGNWHLHTRKHSSRMRTTRLPIASHGILGSMCKGRGCGFPHPGHTHPPWHTQGTCYQTYPSLICTYAAPGHTQHPRPERTRHRGIHLPRKALDKRYQASWHLWKYSLLQLCLWSVQISRKRILDVVLIENYLGLTSFRNQHDGAANFVTAPREGKITCNEAHAPSNTPKCGTNHCAL